MNEIIFLEPVFKEMIWGGTRLRDTLGYEIPSCTTGEAWVVSSHPQGDCLVSNGAYKGLSLSRLWAEHRELFGGLEGDQFPLLVKFIDARDDLSLQVHPDSAYAWEHENGASGKTECWYILDCDEDASIVIGHTARTRGELRQMAENHQWAELIRERPIHPGDFFQITPGTLHAIKKGTLLIETQQNSNITYRLYDYDRLSDGKPRELQVEKCLDVIRCPHRENVSSGEPEVHSGYVKTPLISCDYYTVDKLEVMSEFHLTQKEAFFIVSIIDGEGTADGLPVKKGVNFLIPSGCGTCVFRGTMTLIISHV